jgi:SAM-dependent methyltransferase
LCLNDALRTEATEVEMRRDVQLLSEYYAKAAEGSASDLAALGWPNAADLAARFEVLLSGVDFSNYSPSRRLKLLDIGCGLGLLLEYLVENSLIDLVDYRGVDLVEPILVRARERWPGHRFELRDIRVEPYGIEEFDYCILCGVFTVRVGKSYQETVESAQGTLQALWPMVKMGLGFNSMSKHVDWERDDLFHWPLDEIMAFCKARLSRHVSLNVDYGLWETATLVRKEPRFRNSKVPGGW